MQFFDEEERRLIQSWNVNRVRRAEECGFWIIANMPFMFSEMTMSPYILMIALLAWRCG